ncbi:MAG: hypothetical protein KC609_06465 [Myxococcales bacterium]|nr:hypothetical protein [Myxococcales bacterium]
MHPIHELEAIELSGDGDLWQLSLYSDRLQLRSHGGTVLDVIRREVLPLRLLVVDSLLAPRTIVVSFSDGDRRSFQLEREEFDQFRGWLGPPTRADLIIALNRRLRFMLPIGLMLMLLSLPIAGDPPKADFIGMGMGAVLVVLGLLNRYKPSRWLFLIDAAWFCGLSLRILFDITRGASEWWFVFIILGLWLTSSGITHFRVYRSATG